MKYLLTTAFIIGYTIAFSQNDPGFTNTSLFNINAEKSFGYEVSKSYSFILPALNINEGISSERLFMPTEQFFACPGSALQSVDFTFLGKSMNFDFNLGNTRFNSVYRFDMNGVLRDHEFSIDLSRN